MRGWLTGRGNNHVEGCVDVALPVDCKSPSSLEIFCDYISSSSFGHACSSDLSQLSLANK